MTDNKDVARTWLEGLAARGITTRIVNGRIRHWPASAYKSLTDAEILVLRHHRQAIKDAILTGVVPDVALPFEVIDRRRVKPESAETPAEPCAYCGQTPCCGPEHFAYATLHANDPGEIKKREDEHAREFWMQLASADPRMAYRWASRELK
jgi:hypothetical protein